VGINDGIAGKTGGVVLVVADVGIARVGGGSGCC